MAMAPKENVTDHTVWTSVYLDALVSSAFVIFQVYESVIILWLASLFYTVQIHNFASKQVLTIKGVEFCKKYYFFLGHN